MQFFSFLVPFLQPYNREDNGESNPGKQAPQPKSLSIKFTGFLGYKVEEKEKEPVMVKECGFDH